MKCSLGTNAIDFIFTVFRLVGWMAVPNWGRAKKLIHRTYGIIAFTLVSVSEFEQLRGIKDRFSIIEYGSGFTAIAEVLGVFYSMFVTVLFAVYAKQLREFNAELKSTLGFAMKYSPRITASRHGRSAWHSSLIVYMVLFAYEISVFLWSIMPLYDHFFLGSTGRSPRFAFPSLTYGLDPHKEFWVIFSLQFVHGLLATVGLALGFAFPPVICTLLQGQIEILKDSLLKARDLRNGSSLILSRFDPRKRVRRTACGRFISSDGRLVEDEVDLKDCIIHHQQIIRLLDRAKSILTPFLFFSVMYIQIILGNIAVASASIDERHSIILTGSEATLFSLQLFVEAMYINNLRVACSEVGFLAYSMYLQNNKAGKDLLIIVNRANRQEKFSCLFTSSFTSRTVFKTLELVWNYFTIAKGMEEKLRNNGHLTKAHRAEA